MSQRIEEIEQPRLFPEPSPWQLEVVTVRDVTPAMRRIDLTSAELTSFDYLPGQDLSLGFAREDGSTVRRRYTIREFDRDRRLITLDFVMHGGGPGMRWAYDARPGISIDAIGPRGKITLATDAEWHLFAGDATAVPGAFAMIEALRDAVPACAVLQVGGPEEQQPFARAGADVTWRYEADDSEEGGSRLIAALPGAELPIHRGHAYLSGEVGLVNALKSALLSKGWTANQISAKAYWNRGRANAGHGEPEQRAS
jgi:NADPH-dependent ferric siderophore reductase